jgi:hypothetical protein
MFEYPGRQQPMRGGCLRLRFRFRALLSYSIKPNTGTTHMMEYAMNKKQLMILVTTLILGVAAYAGTVTPPQEAILASSGINNCHQICAWRCNGTQNQCYRSCRQYCR